MARMTLAAIDRRYAPPEGRLLLAFVDGAPVVALVASIYLAEGSACIMPKMWPSVSLQ